MIAVWFTKERRGRVWVGIVALAGIAVGFAADARRPQGIAVATDTLVINGKDPVPVGARLLNRYGRSIWWPALRYAGVPSALAHVGSDGTVACATRGDGTLTISHEQISREILVRCRPILDVSWPYGMNLSLGQPPKELTVGAIGLDRRPVTLLHGQASVRDTQIVRLHNGLLYPVSLGHTSVDFEFVGGTRIRTAVVVTRPAIDTTLQMVPGEIHTWHLPRGYYELQLDTAAERTPLALGATNANCAPGHSGPQDYWCLLTDSSSVVVVNQRAGGASRVDAGHLSIVQWPHG